MAAGLIPAVGNANIEILDGEGGSGEGISENANIADIAKAVVSAELPLSVVNKAGAITGTLAKDKVISMLVGLED